MISKLYFISVLAVACVLAAPGNDHDDDHHEHLDTYVDKLGRIIFGSPDDHHDDDDDDDDDDAQGRIVGGSEGAISDFYWQVSLDYFDQHFCGGTIINKQTILTAAHCFAQPHVKKDFRVRAGSQFSGKEGDIYEVQKLVTHPHYNESIPEDNDVAVVFLKKPLTYNVNVGSIPYAAVRPAADFAIVSGWGYTREGGQVSPTLRFVDLPVLSNTWCKEKFRSQLSSTMFCAGKLEGGQDSCQADSGGPLVVDAIVDNKPGKVLIGIVSWGAGCARKGLAGIYTDVAVVHDWIANTIKAHFG